MAAIRDPHRPENSIQLSEIKEAIEEMEARERVARVAANEGDLNPAVIDRMQLSAAEKRLEKMKEVKEILEEAEVLERMYVSRIKRKMRARERR